MSESEHTETDYGPDSFAAKEPHRSNWRYFSYSWLVLTNLIKLIIVFKLFSAATSNFEMIVFVVLVLIYESTSFDLSGLLALEQSVRQDRQYLHILALLKDPLYRGESKDDLDETVGQARNTLKTATVKMYIRAIFGTIIYFYALYTLVTHLG